MRTITMMSRTIALAILGVAHAQGPPFPGSNVPDVSEFHSCKSPHTPPRGAYIALSKPCEFRFYDGGDRGGPAGISDACSAGEGANLLESREIYAMLWPDECVGDFERCYAFDPFDDIAGIDVPESLSSMNVTPPLGATHLSVNCTADREYTVAMVGEITDEIVTGLGDAIAAFKMFSMALLIGCVGGVGTCVWCCCIRPCITPTRDGRVSTPTYQMAERVDVYQPVAVGKRIV